MYIDKIEITNFRSILKDTINVGDVNVFVGNNDAGKSNYLKALNLFFNNQTDFKKDFRFEDDFCSFSIPRAKTAKEIKVCLYISPPKTYQGGRKVRWEKIWRASGLHKEKMEYSNREPFPGKVKTPHWLNRIRFKYVPAIKGPDYFAELMRDLHDTLLFTIEQELKGAAKGFIDKIRDHTKGMVIELKDRVSLDSNVQLPTNLSDLFSTLEFETEYGGKLIPLAKRGDGLKVRHIPVILKYLADHEKKYHTRGDVRRDTIWGYEEPENSLELAKGFEQASDILKYSRTVQMFITTHSAAFYSLKRRADDPGLVTLHSIRKNDSKCSIAKPIEDLEVDHIDKEMGLLPVISPYIEETVRKNEALELQLQDLKEKIAKEDFPTLFVEGDTDKTILTTVLSFKIPNFKEYFKITSPDSGETGGHAFVKNRLIAWANNEKDIKAMGLFDADKAVESKAEVDRNATCKRWKSKGFIKTIKLPFSKNLLEIKDCGFDLEYSIEHLFPTSILNQAKARGWIEDKASLPPTLQNKIDFWTAPATILTESGIPEEYVLYFYKFTDRGKFKFAKYVSNLQKSDIEKRDIFSGFEYLIREIKDYFKIP